MEVNTVEPVSELEARGGLVIHVGFIVPQDVRSWVERKTMSQMLQSVSGSRWQVHTDETKLVPASYEQSLLLNDRGIITRRQ